MLLGDLKGSYEVWISFLVHGESVKANDLNFCLKTTGGRSEDIAEEFLPSMHK